MRVENERCKKKYYFDRSLKFHIFSIESPLFIYLWIQTNSTFFFLIMIFQI